MKQRNTVAPAMRGTKPVASRQDISKQIAQLKAHIQDNLVRAGRLAGANRLDASVRCAQVAIEARAKLLQLVAKYETLQAADPVADKLTNPRKPSTSLVVTRKSFKRWSDK
jgi:DNA topoisomerase IB